jgi:pilus assembly protein Flp/PilA
MRDRPEDQEGATAVEYAIMVALIAIAIVASVTAVGINVQAVFNGFVTAMGWG